SSNSTSRDGSRSLARIAVHSPENPPPTMHRSAVPLTSYGGRGSGRGARSSQYRVVAASASDGGRSAGLAAALPPGAFQVRPKSSPRTLDEPSGDLRPHEGISHVPTALPTRPRLGAPPLADPRPLGPRGRSRLRPRVRRGWKDPRRLGRPRRPGPDRYR